MRAELAIGPEGTISQVFQSHVADNQTFASRSGHSIHIRKGALSVWYTAEEWNVILSQLALEWNQ